MSLADEIHKLQSLRNTGALTDAEFEAAKARLISSGGTPPPLPPAHAYEVAPPVSPAVPSEADVRQWAMFLHLSALAGYLVWGAGLVAPIVMWQMKKKEMPAIDAHGCHAANWVITFIIAAVICIPLCFVLIGFALLGVLGLLGIIFPIIAAVKASNGELWRYPMSITFFKPEATAPASDRSW
ncbi:MAG TPA: DUF4870 domain-containing protein [Verrucomicrobiales bacterium]|jgi:uncharacterized Tic20 family protein|nr:DUF4870 domain-containing protein [Verrucomicrobiales bacterium]